ncbi:hypothetical protein CFP71_00940, partial [Amycolatopsis thailandensis]
IAAAGLLAQAVAPTTVVTVAAGAGVVVAFVAGAGWSRAVSSRRGPEDPEDPVGPAGGTTPVGEHGS